MQFDNYYRKQPQNGNKMFFSRIDALVRGADQHRKRYCRATMNCKEKRVKVVSRIATRPLANNKTLGNSEKRAKSRARVIENNQT